MEDVIAAESDTRFLVQLTGVANVTQLTLVWQVLISLVLSDALGLEAGQAGGLTLDAAALVATLLYLEAHEEV